MQSYNLLRRSYLSVLLESNLKNRSFFNLTLLTGIFYIQQTILFTIKFFVTRPYIYNSENYFTLFVFYSSETIFDCICQISLIYSKFDFCYRDLSDLLISSFAVVKIVKKKKIVKIGITLEYTIMVKISGI